MSDWWTYRPEDFLLFAPRVYWRMLELHNAELWPLHVLTLAGGFVMAVAAFRRKPGHDRWIALVLAVVWVFVGWSFLWNRYATINWATAYAAPAFAVQAALLVILGTFFKAPASDRRGVASWAGLLLVAVGVVAYPVLPALFGRPWGGAEVFGIAPDPTAIATLGFLLAGRSKSLPTLVPLAWCLFSGLTLQTMGDAQAWLPLLAAAITLVALLLRVLQAFRRKRPVV